MSRWPFGTRTPDTGGGVGGEGAARTSTCGAAAHGFPAVAAGPDLFVCAGALPVAGMPPSSAAVGAAGCLPLLGCRDSRGTRSITLARTAIDTATRRKYRIVRIAWPPR